MKKTAGYFFDGLKDGGLTTQAWSLRPSFESVKRSDTSPKEISLTRASLTCVSAVGERPSTPTLQISAGRDSVLVPKTSRPAPTSRPAMEPPVQSACGA